MNTWLNSEKSNQVRFKAIEDLIWEYYIFETPDSAKYYARIEYNEATKLKLVHYQALSLNTLASSYYINEEYNNAIDFYAKSLQKYKLEKDIKGASTIYNNIGNIYKEKGNFVEAIDNYMHSLKIDERLKNYAGMATSLNNIGILYADLGDYQKAIDYYKKSVLIRKKNKDFKGLASPLNNIGNVYENQKNYTKALEYYQKSLKIEERSNNSSGIATSLNNISIIYKALGDQEENEEKAIEYYDKARKLCFNIMDIVKNFEDNSLIANAYLVLATIEEKNNNFKNSRAYAEQALKITLKTGSIEPTRDISSFLYQLNKKEGKVLEALKMHELFIQMEDSLKSINNRDEVIRQEYKYYYEKQIAADNLLKQKEKEITEARFQQERTQRLTLFGGLILMILFAIFIFNRYKLANRQKEIISIKEQETNRQKNLLEIKNKEITDSINYAKRIQAAILPAPKIVKEYLKDSFVLYIPRDIVAGDFYWMEQIENGLIFAAADCTGHGVPGAMVSVLCNNALNRSVREYNLTDPGEILNKTREIIISEFEKSEDDVNDGMDVSLCTLSFDNLDTTHAHPVQLKWAGANNPLWIVRNNELLEYKPDKQPIGKYFESLPFTTHIIDLYKDDCIYIFTDGYKDQFGGETNKTIGKKIKALRMKELLLQLTNESMDVQKQKLEEFFMQWKGKHEQVDDVCVIGVRIS
ncbi:MAG: tetratricopeptide repeat protein [Flavobacteriia bacterium]|nr:tetratricopeptide repeat protein [Flavobacteriia bacterium]